MSLKQFEITSQRDITAKVNQLSNLAHLGFKAGCDKAYIAISRESLEPRTNDQNRLLWPLLTDFSEQVEHYGRKYSNEQWKSILTAAFEGCLTYAPSLDGTGVVALGAKTSKYSKKKFSEFIEFLYAEGSERGVQWSDKSEQSISETRA